MLQNINFKKNPQSQETFASFSKKKDSGENFLPSLQSVFSEHCKFLIVH
jgi:hypothetical protein